MIFKKKNGLRDGDLYSVKTGDHVGQFFIFQKLNENGDLGFLSTPNMENVWVPRDKFDIGLSDDIIEYVERVPKIVRRTVRAKFEENLSGSS